MSLALAWAGAITSPTGKRAIMPKVASARFVPLGVLMGVLLLGLVHAAPDPNPESDNTSAQAAPSPLPPLGTESKSLLEVIKSGGILMVPILACSVLTLVFVLERLVSLRRGTVIPRPFVKRFLHQLEQGRLSPEEALALCEENGTPVAELFAAGVKKWGRPSVEVEQALIDAQDRITLHLRKYLRVLNTVATVCPLLGLLGTVMGMIEAFQAIATHFALGRPELLADGISKALVTTAAGLSVAIPAMVAYLYLSSCVDRRVAELDELGQRLVPLVAGDAPLASKGKARPKPPQAA